LQNTAHEFRDQGRAKKNWTFVRNFGCFPVHFRLLGVGCYYFVATTCSDSRKKNLGVIAVILALSVLGVVITLSVARARTLPDNVEWMEFSLGTSFAVNDMRRFIMMP
jgi:hypothetical protein